MADVILDTNILVDLLAQYYGTEFLNSTLFKSAGLLNEEIVREINRVIRWHNEPDSVQYPGGLIIASSFAFVEIARKFDDISKDWFTLHQFAAFINQPPEWFFISAVDRILFHHLSELPAEVTLTSGRTQPLEWPDAIHVATALSRDEPWFLAVTDSRIKAIAILRDKII